MNLLPTSFDDFLKLLTVLGGTASFLWAVYIYNHNQQAQREQLLAEHARSMEQRRIEAQKPFLDRQLKLYSEAVQVTAIISTASRGADAWNHAYDRFYELFWGELATVENKEVEGQMIIFRDTLQKEIEIDKLKVGERAGPELKKEALKLAHIVRSSLDESWGIRVWTSNRE